MKCKYCAQTGVHLCIGRLKAYQASFTPEQQEQQRVERMESLERAIAAGKVLKDQYGIELVCECPPKRLNQKTLDYLDAIDRGEVPTTTYENSQELFKALGI